MNIFKRNKLLLIGTLLIGTLLVIHACVSYQNATIKNEKDLKNIQLSNNYAMLVVLNNDTHLGGEDYSINIPRSNKDFNIILRKEFLLVDPGVQKISYYRGRNKEEFIKSVEYNFRIGNSYIVGIDDSKIYGPITHDKLVFESGNWISLQDTLSEEFITSCNREIYTYYLKKISSYTVRFDFICPFRLSSGSTKLTYKYEVIVFDKVYIDEYNDSYTLNIEYKMPRADQEYFIRKANDYISRRSSSFQGCYPKNRPNSKGAYNYRVLINDIAGKCPVSVEKYYLFIKKKYQKK